jgi:hypothetical protein
MRWKIAIARVPTEPSRHRVRVWRECVKGGALSLQQSTWALPAGTEADDLFNRVGELVARAGGQLLVFEAKPSGATADAMKRSYTEQREAAWVEFIAECGKFDAEIASEFEKQKFTLAELDEEEQNLDRLRRWFRELSFRDQFGAPSAPEAETRMKSVTETLERFAEAVFAAREQT